MIAVLIAFFSEDCNTNNSRWIFLLEQSPYLINNMPAIDKYTRVGTIQFLLHFYRFDYKFIIPNLLVEKCFVICKNKV